MEEKGQTNKCGKGQKNKWEQNDKEINGKKRQTNKWKKGQIDN